MNAIGIKSKKTFFRIFYLSNGRVARYQLPQRNYNFDCRNSYKVLPLDVETGM